MLKIEDLKEGDILVSPWNEKLLKILLIRVFGKSKETLISSESEFRKWITENDFETIFGGWNKQEGEE